MEPLVAPPEDEDEFYLADLIGLAVVGRDGQAMGTVRTVQNFGAGDLLEIAPPEGESFYLPFTREAVPEVDIAAGRILAVKPTEVSDGSSEAS